MGFEVDRPVRVLVVDDEPDLRILLWLAVEADERCQVVADASDGREGVEMAVEHQPDVIVLDHLMPRMNGIEAVPLLRQAAPDCKIIMLSALGHPHMRAEAIRAGADAYMEKSASFKPLLDLAVTLARTPKLAN
jgi:DNA-binding NarL/FixJ family response regulator